MGFFLARAFTEIEEEYPNVRTLNNQPCRTLDGNTASAAASPVITRAKQLWGP